MKIIRSVYRMIIFCLVVGLSLQQCFTNNDRAITVSPKDILDGSTNFALQLFKSINKNTGPTDNVMFSPMSIWSALMVTYLGAGGQTEAELANALGIRELNKGGVGNAYYTLKDMYLQTNQPNYTLRMANRLYFDAREPIRSCMRQIFQSEIQTVDFTRNAEATRLAINRWIESQTNKKIKDMLPSGSVDPLTKMIILNAAYFKGFWKDPFVPQVTRQENFYVQPNTPIKANFMHQELTYPFATSFSLNCDALELPYVGEDISMIVLLPRDSVEELISRISQQSLQTLFQQMSPVLVKVSLPKFKAEQSLNLNDILADLGIKDLFDPSRADLSGFTGKMDSSVQSAIHKAYIEVNEEGTEAAAATALLTTYSLKHSETFRADRPFIFLIRDNVQNTILFAGLIKNPK